MIELITFDPALKIITRTTSVGQMEISRLLAAAVLNPNLRQLLLNDPELALISGFQGESFVFSREEHDLILSIRANSLADLANQLAQVFNGHTSIFMNHLIQPGNFFEC